jgi:hypothetical protein
VLDALYPSLRFLRKILVLIVNVKFHGNYENALYNL